MLPGRGRPQALRGGKAACSNVFVHLFQKAAGPKGGALGRHPQMAECPMLQAHLGGLGGFCKRKSPQGLPFLCPLCGRGPPRGGGGAKRRWGPYLAGGAFSPGEGLALPFCQCLPHGGRWPGGPERGRPLFRFAAAPSQPLRRQLPPRGRRGRAGRRLVLRRGSGERDPSAAWRRQLPLQGEPKRGAYLSDFPAATGRGCRVSPRRATPFLARPRKGGKNPLRGPPPAP